MKKLISIFVLASFLVSDFAIAADFAINNRLNNSVNLAPPIVLDDIADNTPHNKNIVLAEMALEMDLEVMDSLREIDGSDNIDDIRAAFKKLNLLKEKSYEKNSNYRPDKIIVFFNSI